MDKFSYTVRQDTPRLVVTYKNVDSTEQFQWGIVGQIPLLNLIGTIVRIQSELGFTENNQCPELALVIAWDAERRTFDWFIHPDIPTDSMCGMLETIKLTIVSSKMGQQVASNQVQVLGPDGLPLRR